MVKRKTTILYGSKETCEMYLKHPKLKKQTHTHLTKKEQIYFKVKNPKCVLDHKWLDSQGKEKSTYKLIGNRKTIKRVKRG